MKATTHTCEGHAVVDEADRYARFYDQLGQNVFPWVTQGTKSFGNMDTYVYSSIQGTLSSIKLILQDGRINDAYALLRKYYDSVIINIYSILYLEENFSIDSLIVQQIDDWLSGKQQLPEYRRMSQYVRSSQKVSAINDILHADDRYKKIRDRCNDNMHYNYYRNVLLNDNKIHLSFRGRAIDEFRLDLKDVFILHLAYVFCVRENYLMSSDHLDSLELGFTPEPGSQFWVAPFIKDIFDSILSVHRQDLATFIRSETNMHLE